MEYKTGEKVQIEWNKPVWNVLDHLKEEYLMDWYTSVVYIEPVLYSALYYPPST